MYGGVTENFGTFGLASIVALPAGSTTLLDTEADNEAPPLRPFVSWLLASVVATSGPGDAAGGEDAAMIVGVRSVPEVWRKMVAGVRGADRTIWAGDCTVVVGLFTSTLPFGNGDVAEPPRLNLAGGGGDPLAPAPP
mmetsp:Transcript_58991/g.111262  ORF Transcript_58991/g.111262 Transcript_58991/m.111262 type:complete len:137 (-) Transcript_58991:85-495(-)